MRHEMAQRGAVPPQKKQRAKRVNFLRAAEGAGSLSDFSRLFCQNFLSPFSKIF